MVLRVFNDSLYVWFVMRERVFDAIGKFGYCLNWFVWVLVIGCSYMFGVLSFDMTFYGLVSILFVIERAVYAAGYFVSIVSSLVLDAHSLCCGVERLFE